jgi:5-methylcytosine-specific restriction endonuclease McrA
MAGNNRKSISIATKVEVHFQDRWLCYLCNRPTIFHLALKHLAGLVGNEYPNMPLAYWNPQWRRDAAPLLDELAACIDHVEALAKGGAHDISNFRTICARCNARKSSRVREEYVEDANPWIVIGKYGEPKTWDGLTSVFVVLARRASCPLTATERGWLRALEAKLNSDSGTLGART